MEFKGTKGEWEIMMDDDEIKVIQSGSLENGSGWRSYVAICVEVQCIEDANLIAATPDLLAALQLIISYHDDGNCELHSEDVAMARAAISKALGEE